MQKLHLSLLVKQSNTSPLMLQDLIDRWQYRPAASSRLLWLWVCGVVDICLAMAGGRSRCRCGEVRLYDAITRSHAIKQTQRRTQPIPLIFPPKPVSGFNEYVWLAGKHQPLPLWKWYSCRKTMLFFRYGCVIAPREKTFLSDRQSGLQLKPSLFVNKAFFTHIKQAKQINMSCYSIHKEPLLWKPWASKGYSIDLWLNNTAE